ncbi:MAG: hypothetical protein ACRDZ3_04975 [Acidimicrobiia bacterium]
MRKIIFLAAVIVLVGAVGISVSISASPVDLRDPGRYDPALSGRFFASAGEGAAAGDLYEVQFNPPRLHRRTSTGRVYGMGGCDTDLVVTVADQSVGYRDELRRFADDQFLPVAGLADPAGARPALTPDCRAAFVRLDHTTDRPTERLMVFDPETEATTELRTAAPPYDQSFGVPAWGPDGEVAVLEGTAAEAGALGEVTGIVVISPDGSERILDPPVEEFGALAWAPSQWMALGDGDSGTVFLNPATGEQSSLDGWVPLTWSPDGMRLLVAEARERRLLGLVDLADLGGVRAVGKTEDVAIHDVVWLPYNTIAVGPPTVGRVPGDGDDR